MEGCAEFFLQDGFEDGEEGGEEGGEGEGGIEDEDEDEDSGGDGNDKEIHPRELQDRCVIEEIH